MVAIVTGAGLLFGLGAWIRFRTGGARDLTGILLAAFAVLGVVGVLETLGQRVELSDDELHITRWWVRRSYPKDSIARVTSEKGVEAGLQLADGRWIQASTGRAARTELDPRVAARARREHRMKRKRRLRPA